MLIRYEGRRPLMNDAISGLIGAAIGAIAGVLGGLFAIRAERKLEYQKWVRGREDDVRRDVRLAVAEVANKLAALAHAVMWFTYKTVATKQEPSPSILETFDKEVHELTSNLVGAQIRLAELDSSLYKQITPFVSDAINLTERVFEGTSLMRENTDHGIQALSECNQAALKFIKTLPQQIANLIGISATISQEPFSSSTSSLN